MFASLKAEITSLNENSDHLNMNQQASWRLTSARSAKFVDLIDLSWNGHLVTILNRFRE